MWRRPSKKYVVQEKDDCALTFDRLGCSLSATSAPKLIAVAGGRDGVGKTVFAAMLGICLAGFERRTILVDLDFSDANVGGYLNLAHAEKSLNRYFAGRSIHLAQIIRHTPFAGLDAITLQSDELATTWPRPWQKRRLRRQLRQLDADYVILDLGSASSDVGLDFFLTADDAILLSTGDVFSVVNSYSFIRSALLRNLKRRFYDHPDLLRMVDECGLLVDCKLVKPLNSMMRQLDLTARERFLAAAEVWQTFRPRVVLNFRQDEDLDDFILLGPITRDLLNIELDYWGHIRFDENIARAVRAQRPEQLLRPTSPASEDVVRLVIRHLIARESRFGDQRLGWPEDKNRFSMFDAAEALRCTHECPLWDRCSHRAEGRDCAKMNFTALKKAG